MAYASTDTVPEAGHFKYGTTKAKPHGASAALVCTAVPLAMGSYIESDSTQMKAKRRWLCHRAAPSAHTH